MKIIFRQFLLLVFFVYCAIYAFSATSGEKCSSSGVVQYKPDGNCDTVTRTCCGNGYFSDWDSECSEEDNCKDGYVLYEGSCKPIISVKISGDKGSADYALFSPGREAQESWVCYEGSGSSYTEWSLNGKVIKSTSPKCSIFPFNYDEIYNYASGVTSLNLNAKEYSYALITYDWGSEYNANMGYDAYRFSFNVNSNNLNHSEPITIPAFTITGEYYCKNMKGALSAKRSSAATCGNIIVTSGPGTLQCEWVSDCAGSQFVDASSARFFVSGPGNTWIDGINIVFEDDNGQVSSYYEIPF